MSYVGYSPWTDAANLGGGIGDALGKILLQRPEMRARVAAQQQEQQEQAQRFPLEQQLLQSQIKNADFRPQYQQDMVDLRGKVDQAKIDQGNEGLDLKTALLALQQQLGAAKIEQGSERADAAKTTADATAKVDAARVSKLDSAGGGKQPTPAQQQALVNVVQKVLPQITGGYPGSGGQTNASPDQLSAIVAALRDPANAGKIPAQVVSQFVTPNVETRGHWFGPDTTVTNGANVRVPVEQGQGQPTASVAAPASAQVPPPDQRPVGTKVTTVKGTFSWDGSGWIPLQQ